MPPILANSANSGGLFFPVYLKGFLRIASPGQVLNSPISAFKGVLSEGRGERN
jgi:hypothetical protein